MIYFLVGYAVIVTVIATVCFNFMRYYGKEAKTVWENRDYWKIKAEEYSTIAGGRYTGLAQILAKAEQLRDLVQTCYHGQHTDGQGNSD